jgi:hypothetical protein
MNKPMSNKSPAMINFIENTFPGTKQAIDANQCPTCKKSIDEREFRDALSRKEYLISGMCQNCQDLIWG